MIRKLILLFFVYLLAEGALRKWLLPEASAESFVLKDLILLAAFIAFLSTNLQASLSYFRREELTVWMLWLMFLIGFFLLRSPSLARIAGLRYYLAPLPLLLLVPYAIGDLRNLQRVSIALMLATIPICILGCVQYLSPIDAGSTATRGPRARSRSRASGWARTTTCSWSRPSSRDVDLLVHIDLRCLSRLRAARGVGRGGERGDFSHAAARQQHAAAGDDHLAMTGSRGPMIIGVVLSLPFVHMLTRRLARSASPVAALISVLVPVLGALTFVVVDVFEALAVRFAEAGDTENRLLGVALYPFTTLLNIDPLGRGIGATFAGME